MSELKVTVNEQLQQLQIMMHRTMFHRYGKMHNPHRGQGRILALLRLKPEISQKELTYLLNMSKQAVAELIAKLEKNGYVTREPAENDRRIMTIRLTEKGADAADDADDTTAEGTKMLDCLNDDELAALSDYLRRIIKQYEEQFPDEDFEHRRQMMADFMSSHDHGFEHWKTEGRGFGRHGRNFSHGFGGHEHCRHNCDPSEASNYRNGGFENDGDSE